MAPPQGAYTALVDGYNAIKPHPELGSLPLEEGRKRLIAALQSMRWPMPVGRCIVVFDGPETSHAAAGTAMRVQYASPSADDYIRRYIRRSPRPERLIVITRDREIRDTAAAYRAQTYTPDWMFARCAPKRAAAKPVTPENRGPRVPPGAARRINEELRNLWVKEKD